MSQKTITMDKAVKPFKEWLEACARSPKTISNNVGVVTCWIREMKLKKMQPSAITVKHVGAWINDKRKDSKRSTRAIALSCIRSFFAFMAANGWIHSDPSRLVRVDFSILSHTQKESKVREPFTDEELTKLIEWLENNDQKFWHFAVLCSKENGLRLGDICQLGWLCFTKSGELSVWTDKTNKRLVHKMSPELDAAFQSIIPTDATYLFPEQRALVTDIKKRGLLSLQFTRILDGLGIADKSFHHLRHKKVKSEDINTLAKSLARKLSIEEIKQLLGHSSSRTTESYVHT